MKETNKLLAIYLMIMGIFVIYSCNKELEEPVRINFGVLPMSTNIKSFTQNGNIVVVDFETTIGAKYSTLIIPFGKEEPVRKEGFTAIEEITRKVFDLRELPKQDYDLIFIDINGNEIKHPIIIK
jgi:hypothetical protein